MRNAENARAVALIVAAGAVGVAATALLGSKLRPDHLEYRIDAKVQVPRVEITKVRPPSGLHFRVKRTETVEAAENAKPAPIVYIDGVRVDHGGGADFAGGTFGVADLNPDEIDRVEVLKGPAAVRLYGSEAENGVIQIFLKKGARNGASGAGADSGSN